GIVDREPGPLGPGRPEPVARRPQLRSGIAQGFPEPLPRGQVPAEKLFIDTSRHEFFPAGEEREGLHRANVSRFAGWAEPLLAGGQVPPPQAIAVRKDRLA